MNSSTHSKDIRPNLGTILDGYERNEYKTYSALAELIDNSTASYFSHKKELQEKYNNNFTLKIVINYDKEVGKHGKLEIIDNAYGMDRFEFDNAVTLAHRPLIQGGRNEYGMGLKTSASWFGKTWEVSSTKLNANLEYSTKIDIKHLISNNLNTIEILEKEVHPDKHGTKISITNLCRRIEKKELEKLTREIESLYRRDLEKGDIEIYINEHKCFFNPYSVLEIVEDGVKIAKKNEFEDSVIFEGMEYPIKGFIGILAEGSYSKAGLVLFRRGRVINGGEGRNYKPQEIFGAANSPVSLRLFGEIDLDTFPVTQAKSLDWDSNGLEEKFISKVFEIFEKYITFAKTYRVPTKESKPMNVKETKNVGDSSLESFPYDLDVYGFNIKRDNFIQTKTDNGVTSFSFPLKIENENFNNFADRNYNFEIKYLYSSQLELFSYREEKNKENKIIIDINLGFSLFEKLNGNKEFRVILTQLIISLVLSELIARKKAILEDGNFMIQSDEIRVLLNRFLKESSKNYDYNN